MDPEAFQDHPIEQRQPLAAIQWAARRRIALDHAEAAKVHLTSPTALTASAEDEVNRG